MPDNLEVVTLQIANSTFKPFIVTSIYRPPGKPVSYFNDMEALLASWGIQTVIFWIHQTTTPKI